MDILGLSIHGEAAFGALLLDGKVEIPAFDRLNPPEETSLSRSIAVLFRTAREIFRDLNPTGIGILETSKYRGWKYREAAIRVRTESTIMLAVRLYVNELTGLHEVGKRFDTLGVETAIAAREGALLQRIQHPHLVPVFSVAEVLDDHLTTQELRPVIEITMPYYDRGSICDAFARGERFSVREARDIAVAALRGLSELHIRHGILHRDVKTPNIFLAEPTSLVRVGGLGAAAEIDQVGSTEGLGTPQLWTAPENFTEGRLTVQSDVYSMGIVLIELLAGPLPYEEYDRAVMLERLSEGRSAPWPRHLQVPPFVPPEIRRVVNTATRVDPTRRFDSATAMARRLSEARIIDWHLEIDDPTEKVWRGAAVSRSAKEYRVEAKWRPRKEAWTVSARRRQLSWRRVFDDVDISDLDSNELVLVFDRVVRSAFR